MYVKTQRPDLRNSVSPFLWCIIESGGKLDFGLFVSFYVQLTSIDHPFRSPSLTFFVMLNWFTNIITGEHVIVSHYHIVVFIGEKKLTPKIIPQIQNNEFKSFSDGKK